MLVKESFFRKAIGLILLVTLFVLPWYSPFQIYLSIPSEIKTFSQSDTVDLPKLSDDIAVTSMKQGKIQHATDLSEYSLEESGNDELTYTVANFPVKKVNLEVYDDFRIIPGGQSIGINLHTQGS